MRTTLGEITKIDNLSKLDNFPKNNYEEYSKYISLINSNSDSR